MFQVTARTVLELGSELISSDIIAFYELIKNGIDAGSGNGVEIRFNIVLGHRDFVSLKAMLGDTLTPLSLIKQRAQKELKPDAYELFEPASSKITSASSKQELLTALEHIYSMNSVLVRDTGTGMSLDDLSDKFLVIGTASRKKDVEASVEQKKPSAAYLGEKGLGRLSAMRLGGKLDVKTTQKTDSYYNELSIDWSDFEDVDAMIDDIPITPKAGNKKESKDETGTELTISALNSDWTSLRLKEMATQEFTLLFDPMANVRNRKRVALFWNEERVPIPNLQKKFLDLAHASVKGKFENLKTGCQLTLEIRVRNLGYDHPVHDEVLKFGETDLYGLLIGLDTGFSGVALSSLGDFSFEAHWFNRRIIKAANGMDREQILKLHRQWTGVRIYRDGYRVYPYGQERDDWLGLDRQALMAKGYLLNKIQLVGQVNISRVTNPQLIDQTNREGLRETPEQRIMLDLVRQSIQLQLRGAMKRVDGLYKQKRVKPVAAKTEIARLENRAKVAIMALRSSTSGSDKETISELQQTLLELTELARILRERNAEVENDARQMQDMAGIGLLVEMVAHELARTSENALDNINRLKANSSPEEVAKSLDSLAASMKSIQKRLRILDPLSVSGRQAPEKFSLTEILQDTVQAHKNQFDRHNIELDYEPSADPMFLKTVKGYVVQVVENLISNSVYWLKLEAEKSPLFQPKVSIFVSDAPFTITYSDNGPGISSEHLHHVFEMYFSLKETRKRRGLGLYIARQCAISAGGSLELDDSVANQLGRLNQFIYTIAG